MALPANWSAVRLCSYLVDDDNDPITSYKVQVVSSQARLQDAVSHRIVFPEVDEKTPAVADGYFFFDVVSDTDPDITPSGRQHKVTLLQGNKVVQTWYVTVDHADAVQLRFDGSGNIVTSGGTLMDAVWLTDLQDFSDAPVVTGGGGGGGDLSNYFTKAQTTSQVSAGVATHVALSDPHTQYATLDELTAAATPDASTTVRGKARILGGTPDAPTVPWTSVTSKPTIPSAKADVGLGNVDNTADTAKPVSTAQQTALNGKTALTVDGVFTGSYNIDTTPVTAEDLGAASQASVDRLTAATGYTGTFRGAWAGSIAYAVGDVVTVQNGIFRCVTAHTSNGSGFQFDRDRWMSLRLPALTGSTVVPVRGLNFTQVGTGSLNPPIAGVFQQRPRQFDYSRERLVKAFTQASDFVASGSTASIVTGSQIGGSVVITSGTTTSSGYAHTASLPTVNLTDQHIRVTFRVTASAGRAIDIQLTSAGTSYTNYLKATLMWGNVDGFRVNQFTTVAIPLSEFTAIGTGADIAAINGMRLKLDQPAASPYDVEIAKMTYHPNPTGKAKAILWIDDNGWSNHITAISTAARYGFPMTIASVGDNFVNGNAAVTIDQAIYAQNYLGAQVCVHAYGPQDHGRPAPDGGVQFEELLAHQHFGMAAGLHGMDDLAYWNTGLPGNTEPYADHNVRKLFRSARGARSRLPETLPPADPFMTSAFNVGGSNTSVGHFQPYAERAIACKGLAQYLWHDMPTGVMTEFSTFCAWLDANRSSIEVVTPRTAYDPLCT